MRDVIHRVNANSRQMDFLLRGGGLSASVRYVEEGSTRRQELRGVMLYERPRSLYVALKHTFDDVLQIGSNDRQFWVWDLQHQHYWWGEHGDVHGMIDADVPIRPDHLIEVLGLELLPTDTTGPEGPAFRVWPEYYELAFLETDETGQLWFVKDVRISRREPYLISQVNHYTPDGLTFMSALLDRYQIVKGSCVQAPYRIEIAWPTRKGSATLAFLEMKRFDKEAARRYFVSPLERLGETELRARTTVERIGQPEPVVPLPSGGERGTPTVVPTRPAADTVPGSTPGPPASAPEP
jgi:hypothetical protein